MCSLENDQTIKIGSKRGHRVQVIDIPPSVSIGDAMKVYNIGWGHATANALHYFIEHVDVIPEYGSDFQPSEFIEWMKGKNKERNVHLVGKK